MSHDVEHCMCCGCVDKRGRIIDNQPRQTVTVGREILEALQVTHQASQWHGWNNFSDKDSLERRCHDKVKLALTMLKEKGVV
jgi:hypothetical protein